MLTETTEIVTAYKTDPDLVALKAELDDTIEHASDRLKWLVARVDELKEETNGKAQDIWKRVHKVCVDKGYIDKKLTLENTVFGFRGDKLYSTPKEDFHRHMPKILSDLISKLRPT